MTKSKISDIIYSESERRTKKEVYCFDKEGNFIQKFEAIADAAHWLVENNITVLSSGVRSHISEAMRGIRKSAYGYIWKDSLD